MNGFVVTLMPLQYQVFGGQEFPPNTAIKITCPVTSRSSGDARVKLKLQIYEGSWLPGHGAKLKEYLSAEKTISPGAMANFVFNHTTVEGTIDRRDVGVVVQYWDDSKWVDDGSSQWDDLYYVRVLAYSFEIGQPTVQSA